MISTAPTATCCQNGCTPTITKPFCRTAGMNTPKTVPSIVPTPPNRLVPPITTAAIACRLSVEWPPIVVVREARQRQEAGEPGERAGRARRP